jgi:hypothetical protein
MEQYSICGTVASKPTRLSIDQPSQIHMDFAGWGKCALRATCLRLGTLSRTVCSIAPVRFLTSSSRLLFGVVQRRHGFARRQRHVPPNKENVSQDNVGSMKGLTLLTQVLMVHRADQASIQMSNSVVFQERGVDLVAS